MTWQLVDLISQLLEPAEREVVRGDLMEAGENAWGSLAAVAGLVIRRDALLWKTWRPWLAAFGLALPGSLLLMGFSISVSQAFERIMGPPIQRATGVAVGAGFWLLLCNVLLLLGWAWTGGFVVGVVSRRTLWISAAFSFAPCLFCLERFRVASLSRFCLLIFLAPAILGVWQGLRVARIKLRPAIVLAAAVTALTVPAWSSHGPWIPNLALSWPAWYLVATAYPRGRREVHQ